MGLSIVRYVSETFTVRKPITFEPSPKNDYHICLFGIAVVIIIAAIPRKKDLELAKLKSETLKFYGEIYYMLNTKNGKGYIGQTQLVTGNDNRNHGTSIRTTEHFNEARKNLPTCRYLNNAIRKWGGDAFTVTALICCKIEHLSKWEDYFMDLYNTRVANGKGYNLREAGRCGRASEETLRKMSESLRGEKHPQWGKPVREETKEKIRQTNISNAVRYDKDDVTLLPKYMKYVNWGSEEGYHIVSHPLCRQKKFVSTSKPVKLDAHKLRALEYLETLNKKLEEA